MVHYIIVHYDIIIYHDIMVLDIMVHHGIIVHHNIIVDHDIPRLIGETIDDVRKKAKEYIYNYFGEIKH